MGFKLNLGTLGVGLDLDSDGFKRDVGVAKRDVSSAASGITGLAKKMGPAVALGIGVATTAIAGAAAGIGKLVSSFANAADEAAKAAKRIGVSTEEFQELSYAAGLSGAAMNDIENGFRRLGKNANEASMGVGTAKRAFEELGVKVTDSSGELRGQMDLFTDVADRLSKTENATKKVALAQDIFGRSGAKLLPLLNEGAAGIEKMRKEAHELGIVIGGEAAAQAERFNDAMSKLDQAAGGLKNTIGTALIPVFTAASEVMVSLSKEVLRGGQVQEFLKDAVTNAVKGIQGFVRSMINMAKPLSAVISGMKIAVNVWRVFFNVSQIVRKGILTVALSIGQFVTGTLSGFIGGAKEAAKFFGMNGLAGTMGDFEKTVAGVADGMGTVRDELAKSISGDIDDIASSIGGIAGGLDDLGNNAYADKIIAGGEKIISVLDGVGTATLSTGDDAEEAGTKFEQAAEKATRSWIRLQEALDADFVPAIEASGARFGAALEEMNAMAAAHKESREKFLEGEKQRREAALRDGEKSGLGDSAASQLLGPVGEMASGMSAAASSAQMMAAAGGGLVTIFGNLWAKSEGFQKVMSAVSDAMESVFMPFIDGIMKDLGNVLRPILKIFTALGPVLRAALVVMNPIIIPLKLLAKLFSALARPVQALAFAIKKAVDAIKDAIRKLQGKAESGARKHLSAQTGVNITDTGESEKKIIIFFDEAEEANVSFSGAMDRWREATDDASEGVGRFGRSLDSTIPASDRLKRQMHVEELERRRGIVALREFAKATEVASLSVMDTIDRMNREAGAGLGFETFDTGGGMFGVRREQNESPFGRNLVSQADRMAELFGEVNDAAEEMASSMLNVPEVFDANLARFQAAAGGGMVAGGGGLQPGGGAVGGAVYIENFNNYSSNPDELFNQIEAIQRRRTGSPNFSPGTNFSVTSIRRI